MLPFLKFFLDPTGPTRESNTKWNDSYSATSQPEGPSPMYTIRRWRITDPSAGCATHSASIGYRGDNLSACLAYTINRSLQLMDISMLFFTRQLFPFRGSWYTDGWVWSESGPVTSIQGASAEMQRIGKNGMGWDAPSSLLSPRTVLQMYTCWGVLRYSRLLRLSIVPLSFTLLEIVWYLLTRFGP